jgi:signal-transduction protein with cAMP-binding, CBS, and nucleotidyltransferase domain
MLVKDFMVPLHKMLTCKQETTLTAAAEQMLMRGVGSIMVLSPSGQIIGLCTKSDIVYAITAGLKLTSTHCADVMTPAIVYCDCEADRYEAAERMLKYGVHHLLVRNEDYEVVGIISTKDVQNDLLGQTEKCPFLSTLMKTSVSKRSEFEEKCRNKLSQLVDSAMK